MFDTRNFYEFIIEHQIVLYFDDPIILKSGQSSHLYVNWRRVTHDAHLTSQLVDFVLAFVNDNGMSIDTFYGVPDGASKLGVLTQFKHATEQGTHIGSHALAMGRSTPKLHGDPDDRLFLGVPKGRVCVLEDVTTTGQSLVQCVTMLRDYGVDVVATIGLTNRNESNGSIESALAPVPYYAMSAISPLMALMAKPPPLSS